jgi:hypothetical protein
MPVRLSLFSENARQPISVLARHVPEADEVIVFLEFYHGLKAMMCSGGTQSSCLQLQ